MIFLVIGLMISVTERLPTKSSHVFSDWEWVTQGTFATLMAAVSELKIDFGPGYRVYYARTGKVILMLLCGGDKSTQKQDIEHAKRNLQDFQNREAQSRPKLQSSRAPK